VIRVGSLSRCRNCGKPIEATGKLHGLARRVGKIGGEHITFQITIHDLEEWNRLIAFAEQPVRVTIDSPQEELPLGEKGNGLPAGVEPGSEAAQGAHQAQD
jgi:hypothetical protein